MTRIQIGAGDKPIEGFDNLDCRALPGQIQTDACHLPYDNESVDLIFGNAFFEHLYLAHQIPALEEWKRVLTPDGAILIIGIPDFEIIARAYLDGDEGVVSHMFDLLEVHRYMFGCPETDTPIDWREWNAADHENDTPPGWLPQLHKTAADADHLHSLLNHTGLEGTIFRYTYIGEAVPLNLAICAGHHPPDLQQTLTQVPTIDTYIQSDTITIPTSRSGSNHTQLAAFFTERGVAPQKSSEPTT